GARLPELTGGVPELGNLPTGCRFHPRCRRADARCSTARPGWTPTEEGAVRCHHPLEGPGESASDRELTQHARGEDTCNPNQVMVAAASSRSRREEDAKDVVADATDEGREGDGEAAGE